MLVIAFFGWWYSVGWLMAAQKMGARSRGVLEYFSVTQLAGSLFAPFRQISAGRVDGPIGVRLRAWADRLFSRVIGAIVRLLLITVGLLGATSLALLGLTILLVWPFVPFLPIIGFIIMSTGYIA